MGTVGDDSVAPALLEWSSQGKPTSLRGIAIGSLARTDVNNHDITARLISYLNEPSFDIRYASIYALGRRGDPAAIEPLEALLKSGQLSISVPHTLEGLIAQLKAKNSATKATPATTTKSNDSNAAASSSSQNQAVLDRLDQLEHQISEMNDRLRRIENSVSSGKSD
jgi:HEAT repeat protein